MERRTEKIGIFAPGMMTPEQYRLLLTPEVRHTVEEQIGRDPAAIALDKRIPHAALVATQVKYLARARTKLPSYYEARCILPPLAFEQASSEACAARKSCSGNTVLDLTCGLGVDALYLSKRFREVITLERDATLAAVAEENFRRLGATNIRVINSSAEAFLASTLDHFDWIYADPDRRSAGGRKLVRLEDCSPDIPKLLPELRRIAPNLCVKNSPLFDVGETFRLFGPCRTEVVSLHDECKEVVVYTDGTGPLLTAVALELGEFSCTPAEARATPCDKPFDPGRLPLAADPRRSASKSPADADLPARPRRHLEPERLRIRSGKVRRHIGPLAGDRTDRALQPQATETGAFRQPADDSETGFPAHGG